MEQVVDKKKKKNAAASMNKLTTTETKALENFKQTMKDEIIPDIIKMVEERRLLAADSRNRQLKSY